MSQPEFEYLGPYHVERILGRGGMGTVYKGVHSRSGEPIAIKVIATGVANSPRFRRRFDAEIKTLQRLKHPGIVQLVGFGEEQGLLFYTMEYVDGHSLHEHLRQHSRLPWQEVIQIGIETASALKHAHDLGIIHRDLKPANLMLNKAGKVKLTDFGISKLFGSTDMTAVGSVIGTADYMPPEQAEGKGVTVRSDLYSLGSVLYALLCGKAPFGGKSVPEVLYSVRYNPVPSLLEQVPNVPKELSELIDELLAKEPSKRPPTALVVANRLKSLQQGLAKLQSSDTGTGHDREGTLSDSAQPLGTHLTSLDLDDIEEEEVQLTGEEMSRMGLDEELADETHKHEPGIGTHEQQTMLAPDILPADDLQSDSKPSQSVKTSRRESEFSGEFHTSLSVEEPVTSGGPSHYTPVAGDKPLPATLADEPEGHTRGPDWLQIGSIVALVAVLLGSIGFGWYLLQPDSADELYKQILVAADTGDDSELLANRRVMEEFLERFPDDERGPEVQAFIDSVELVRWTKILRRRAAQEGGENELSAVEQAFLDAMRARSEDFRLGQTKLDAFLSVFGKLDGLPPKQKRLVELVQVASRMGSPTEAGLTLQATEDLAQLIQTAEETLSDVELKSYYNDLSRLYGDKAWAAEQLERLQGRLQAE